MKKINNVIYVNFANERGYSLADAQTYAKKEGLQDQYEYAMDIAEISDLQQIVKDVAPFDFDMWSMYKMILIVRQWDEGDHNNLVQFKAKSRKNKKKAA